MQSDQSKLFSENFKILKFFGIWPGIAPSKHYKYFSFIYLLVTFVIYFILLTLNLLYTPRKIELLLREVIFYFTEITVLTKILTILFLRDKLVKALNIIDCDAFVGDYENKEGILYKFGLSYRLGWKFYNIMSHVVYSSSVLLPIFLNLIRGNKTELPVCKYYFLSDEVRDSYFGFWFIYQSLGIYGHMMYNINVDALIAGFMCIAIAQLRLLNINLSSFKLSEEERLMTVEVQDKIQITKLNKHLWHYEVILRYCTTIQDFLGIILFFQFSVTTLIICVSMCGLCLASSTEMRVFLVLYFLMMTMQIFVPGLLGTHLTYESQEIITAAYSSEWVPRSELFKRSLKLLMERAKTSIIITGLNIFPISLVTFISIMKTAYSFFTLIRTFQEE